MFLINNEPLMQKSHPDHFKWLEDRKKEIRAENKKVYHFSGFNRKSKVRDENGRMVDVHRTRAVPVTATFSDPEKELNSHDEWIYVPSLSACKTEGGIYKPYKKTTNLTYDTIFDSDRDIDLIVFFKFLCKNKNVIEVDNAKINKEKADKQALESQVHWYIYNPSSPIHPNTAGTEDVIRNIAMSWKISGADEKDVYSIMNELWDTVQAADRIKQSGRGFESFCKEVSSKGSSDKRATILLAIQREVLSYKDNQWSLQLKGGDVTVVCGVPLGQEAYKDERVVNFIVNDEYYYKEVLMSMEGINPMAKLKRPELFEKCEELGWSKGILNKTSNERMAEIIEKKLKPEDA